MHTMYKKIVEDYFTEQIQPSLVGKLGEVFLLELVKQWNNYTIFAMLLNRLFDYLDINYVKSNFLNQLGKQCQLEFKNRVIIGLEAELQAAIRDQITRDRDQEMINRDALKTAIGVYVDLGKEGEQKPIRREGRFFWQGTPNLDYYVAQFETSFLELSKTTFENFARNWNQSADCYTYLREVNRAMEREETNADFWLQLQTKKKVVDIGVKAMITDMAQAVVDKENGVVQFFKEKSLDKLHLLFNVFSRDESKYENILNKMKPYIEEEGALIVNEEGNLKDPLMFTQKLLAFKSEIDIMVQESFMNQILFQKTRDQAFMNFMNEQPFTPSYMAQFCDEEQRKGLKGLTEDDVNNRLDTIIGLFRCLHGRDIFMKSYEKELANRLLNKSSLSNQNEELMIQKLKVECGASTVGKISQMMKDMQLSRDIQNEFVNSNQGTNLIQETEFNIEVLSHGTWPSMEPPPLTLPRELMACADKFGVWYKHQNMNKTLTWLYSNGQVEVGTLFTGAKKYQLTVNVYQASILCLFNQVGADITCAQIK